LAQLQARVPVDDREARSVRQFIQELSVLPHPFDREAGLTHVTASAIVIGPRGVLLHRHRRLGLWLQPGGHLEPGEEPWEAAKREAAEETGLFTLMAKSDGLVHVDVHQGGADHLHLDVRFLLEALEADGEPSPGPGESQEVRWFGWDEALDVADPGLAGLLWHLRPATGI
jgi:8-oxo-dGTP pyrophosphatase MutT (NUDIX family)